MEEKDAVIVGARCAGSTLAIELAGRGWDVVMVDRDTFPSDTISTHMMFPNTLARLEQPTVAVRQGIGDAVEQAIYIADHLSNSNPTLNGYREWIDRRAAEHYDWSFSWGRFPKPGVSDKVFAGWASDPEAGQDVRDTFSRQVEPSQVMSKERMARWFSAEPEAALV
jgi:hypothetical protein